MATLGDLIQNGRYSDFMRNVTGVLRQQTVAPDMAKAAIALLLRIGLGGPARELLQLRDDLDPSDPAIAPLREQARATQSGRVTWTSLDRNFRGNLQALRPRRPELAAKLEALARSELPALHLYQGVDGQYFLTRRNAGDYREWLPPLSSLAEEPGLKLPPRGQMGATALVGVRHGNVLRAVAQQTADLLHGMSMPIYLIVPEQWWLAAWLHTDDYAALLADPRLLLFAGSGAVGDLRTFFSENTEITLPLHTINLSGDADLGAAVQSAIAAETQRRRLAIHTTKQALREHYAPRDAAHWASRFNGKLRILAVTSRFTSVLQYSTRDAMAALSDLGHETRIVKEAANHHSFTPLAIGREIADFEPDVVFLIDHTRLTHAYLPPNLPTLTWIQDPLAHLLSRESGESIGAFDFVCGFYRNRCVEEFQYPADQFCNALVPVSTHAFHDGPVPDDECAQFACDIMYAGSYKDSPEEHIAKFLSQSEPVMGPLINALAQEAARRVLDGESLLEWEASELIRTMAAALGIPIDETQREQLTHFVLLRTYDLHFRGQTLDWVARWATEHGRTFRLYGSGWENHPKLRDFAVGHVEHGEPLRRAYACAKLSLQTTPSGFLHQRTHEALASGSLVVSRYTPNNFASLSPEEFIKVRNERDHGPVAGWLFPRLPEVVFNNYDEMCGVLDRFANDADDRTQTLADFRQITLSRFSYHAVLGDVFSAWREYLNAAAADAANAHQAAPARIPAEVVAS